MAGISYTAVPTGGDTCDFCSTSPIAKLYRCRTFNVNGVPVFRGTVGTWAACQKCSSMVESKEWSSLAVYAVQQFTQRNQLAGHDVANLWIQFTKVCQGFSEHVIPED
jgi:hypothetical protein